MVSYSAMRRTFLKYFTKPLNPITPSSTQEVHLGDADAIIAAEVFLAMKTLMAGKAVDVGKSYLKCSKTWTEKLFDSFVCVMWHGVLEGHRKISKLGWSSLYLYEGRQEGAHQPQGICLPSLPRKLYAYCLALWKKMTRNS